MSQQGQWKASALAATFSSGAGFNGTAWGAARAPIHMGNEISFGLGFGQSPRLGGIVQPVQPHAASMSLAVEPSSRRQKRKASSDDESMGSSSPTPEPASRKIRGLESRRTGSELEDPVAAVINSSALPGRRQSSARLMHGVHHADGRKRTRMMDAAAPNEVTLDKLLEPLEEKDVRLLLDTLISQNPHLASQVRQLVPKPTVNSACSQLVRLERRLLAAFPYNKSGPVSDDYTYHRVRPALEELRDTIVMYLGHFTHYGLAGSSTSTSNDMARNEPNQELSSGNALSHPAEWFDLLSQATDVAMRMPKWEKQENNAIRHDTLHQLADGWLRAIMATVRWTEEGHIVGRDMLSRWAQQLQHFYSATGEAVLFEPAVQVFQHSFGQYCARVASRVLPESST
ncbi:Tethering factor for nuclear proteasome sts1 [Coemansia guatemalensis]|uniref:Tethering factor for nuclear proteasome STS1 n=1 Tax=Coemansia guatemalensis TaxID=2761395 RepID=A0A9W8LPT2_9FUNG|nr:Tethering factor for nuclear proteasome sts1 [Coemansia guatemalensis]